MSVRQCDGCGAVYDSEEPRATRVVVHYERRHSMTFFYCPTCSATPVQGATTHHTVRSVKPAQMPAPAPERVDRFRRR